VKENIPNVKKILKIDKIYENLQEMEEGKSSFDDKTNFDNIKNEYAQLSILLGLGFKLSGTELETVEDWKKREPSSKLLIQLIEVSVSAPPPSEGEKMHGGSLPLDIDHILNQWNIAIVASGILNSVRTSPSVPQSKSFGIFKHADLTRPFNRIQGYTFRQGPSLFGRSFADYGKIVNDMGGLKGGFFNGGGIAPFGKNAFLPKHYESKVMLGGATKDETPYFTLVSDIYNQTIKQLNDAGFKLKAGDAESMSTRLDSLKKAEKSYLDEMKKIAEFTKDVNVTGTKNGLDLGVEQMAEIEKKFKEFSKEQRRIEHPFDKMFGILRTRPIKESDDKFKELILANESKMATLLA